MVALDVYFYNLKFSLITNMVQANPAAGRNEEVKADPSKPTVLVLGSIGHGKSTFMNRLAGVEGTFKAGRSVKGVT